MRSAITNCRLFDGVQFHFNKAVLIQNGQIEALTAATTIPDGTEIYDAKGNYLVPGFIDVQINGGSGVLFARDISESALENIYQAHGEDGVTDWLPTLVSTHFEDVRKAIEVVRTAQPNYGLLGLHLEGPYLHPEKRGAHQIQFLRKPTDSELQELLKLGEGVVKMMTIAPELFTERQLAMLAESDWIISAGHSMATKSQALNAFEKGISTVTHLYNAMSPLHHREPGVVGATLAAPKTWANIIVDGVHVDYTAVELAYRLKKGRLFLISDATFVKHPVEEFQFESWHVRYKNGAYYNQEGRLAGASITMLDAVRNCVQEVGIPLEEALRMASAYPAAVLGLDHELGYIRPGYKAHLAVVDEQLKCTHVIPAFD